MGKNIRKITKWKQWFTLFLMIWASKWKYSGHYKHNKNNKLSSECPIAEFQTSATLYLFVCLSVYLSISLWIKTYQILFWRLPILIQYLILVRQQQQWWRSRCTLWYSCLLRCSSPSQINPTDKTLLQWLWAAGFILMDNFLAEISFAQNVFQI